MDQTETELLETQLQALRAEWLSSPECSPVRKRILDDEIRILDRLQAIDPSYSWWLN